MSIQTINHKIELKEGASFSERESTINKEIMRVQDTLRSRGFYPLEAEVKNKNDKTATVVFTYKI